MKTVPEMLREGAETYEARNEIYGDNYKNFGAVMDNLFPDRLVLETMSDWNRLGVLVQIVSKLTRYAENFGRGGHDDSLLDLAVYATMLRELDAELRPSAQVCGAGDCGVPRRPWSEKEPRP